MADNDSLDNEPVVTSESATVNIVQDQPTGPSQNDILKAQALAMVTRFYQPVSSAIGAGDQVGVVFLSECVICAALVRPRADRQILHMRQHLKAERRGDV